MEDLKNQVFIINDKEYNLIATKIRTLDDSKFKQVFAKFTLDLDYDIGRIEFLQLDQLLSSVFSWMNEKFLMTKYECKIDIDFDSIDFLVEGWIKTK